MNKPVSLIGGPPHWCPNAVATKRGWINPINGELLVSTKFIDPAFYSEQPTQIVESDVIEEPSLEIATPAIIDVVVKEEPTDKVVQPKPKKQSLLDKLKGKKK